MSFSGKLKRISAVFLILLLLIPMEIFAENEEASLDCSHELEVLKAIGDFGVIDTSRINEASNRAEACYYLTLMLGLQGGSVKNVYADVTEDTRYAAEITQLSDMGILNGNSSGNFNPDSPVLMQEFCKMIVTSMGYSLPAEAAGGYPVGYIQYANRLGLLDGLKDVSANGIITAAHIIKIIYNSLDASISGLDSISYGSIDINISAENTVLSVFFGCRKETGVVQSTEYGSLTQKKMQKNSNIVIDGKEFLCKWKSGADLLGYAVDYYYKTDYDIKPEILYLEQNEINNTIIIEADNVGVYQNSGLTYWNENGKQKSVKLMPTTDIVYNYLPVIPFDENAFNISRGYVYAIDNNGDSVADVVRIESYRTAHTKQIDYSNKIVFDEYSNTPIKADESNNSVDALIFDRNGNKTTLDAIEEDSVLCCFISYDGNTTMQIREIVDEVLGEITGEITQDGDRYIKIGKEAYKLCDELAAQNPKITVGDKIICYLNLDKEIASIRDEIVSKSRWGFIDAYGVLPGLDGAVEVRLFSDNNADGKLLVFKCAKRTIIDNVSYNTAGEIQDAISSLNKTVVRYSLNANNEIAKIDSPASGSFAEIHSDDTTALYADLKIDIFGKGLVAVRDDTKVFSIPDNFDPKRFRCSTVADIFTHARSYKIKAYALSADKLTADLVLYYTENIPGSVVKESSSVVMIDKIIDSIDENGNECKKIIGYKGREMVTLTVEESEVINSVPALGDTTPSNRYALKRGDVIQTAIDSEGILIDSLLVCRMSENLKVYSTPDPAGTDYADKFYSRHTISGWIYKKDGSFFNVSVDTQENGQNVIYPIEDDTGIYVYNIGNNRVEIGNESRLISYFKAGSQCPSTVVFVSDGHVKAIMMLN